MTQMKKTAKSKGKKGELAEPEDLTYPNQEQPVLEYSDFVRLDASPDGVIFSFGQTHPRRKSFNITHEIIVPLRVAGALHNILGDQLKNVMKRIEEMEAAEKQGEAKQQ